MTASSEHFAEQQEENVVKELLEAAKVVEEAFLMGTVHDIQTSLKRLRLAIFKCEGKV